MQLFEVEYDEYSFGDGLVLGTRLFEVRCRDGVEPQGGDRWRLSGFTYSTPAAEELGLFSSAASGISRGDRL